VGSMYEFHMSPCHTNVSPICATYEVVRQLRAGKQSTKRPVE
jgi:hypothetical protein